MCGAPSPVANPSGLYDCLSSNACVQLVAAACRRAGPSGVGEFSSVSVIADSAAMRSRLHDGNAT